MNATRDNNMLIIGIGNSARSDDGLGWAFLKALEADGGFPAELIYRYQLQVEDASLIKDFDTVTFVDALKTGLEAGFQWKPCLPVASFGFSTHALDPESVTALAQELYGATPDAYTLGICGREWELKEGLSRQARENLEKALQFFRQHIAST